jgi:hypothetical protein
MNGYEIAERWEIESESSPGKKYVVSKMLDGSWACSCIGWTRHVPRRDCKHIEWHKRFGGTALTVDPLLMSLMKLNRKAEKAGYA